jgi:hypothetical protein
MAKVDGQLVFISAITTVLGYEISYEAIAHLYQVGFSSFSVVAGMVAIAVGLLGWFVWFQKEESRLHQLTTAGAGLLGLLSGLLRGIFG